MGYIVCIKCDRQFTVIKEESVLTEDDIENPPKDPKFFTLECPQCSFKIRFTGNSEQLD